MRGFSRILLFFLLLAACRKDSALQNSKVTATDFLSDRKYEVLIVEIQYVNGYQPTTQTLDHLRDFLEKRVNKPGGISFVESVLPSPGKSAYSLAEIKDIEKRGRSQHTGGKAITAYMLYLDGHYAEGGGSSRVLGIAYDKSSMVIFGKTIREYAGGVTQPPLYMLETTVSEHEFGHILGLVNNGTSLQTSHQDVSNGHHCNNTNCLMYYKAETSDIVNNLLGGSIPELDQPCIADLRANGGR